MKIRTASTAAAAVCSAVAFGFVALAPADALAGEYDAALAAVENAVGPIDEANAAPGGVGFRIVSLAREAEAAKAAGDDDTALAKMQEAEALAAAAQ